MEKDPHILDSLIEKLENYGKTNIELIQLRSIKKAAKIASFLYVNIILLIIFILCVILLNIGLSVWVGEICGEIYLGFLFVAAAYAILGLFYLLFMFKYQKAKFQLKLINSMLN